jgi:hypothetical protein
MLIAVLAAFMTASSPVSADNAAWNWLWVVPSPKGQGWSTFTGQANIDFDGQSFDARLEGHGDWDPILSVRGRVAGRQVALTVTELHTDATPQKYAGEYLPLRTPRASPANGWGEDRIVARNGASYLAFHRKVRSPN